MNQFTHDSPLHSPSVKKTTPSVLAPVATHQNSTQRDHLSVRTHSTADARSGGSYGFTYYEYSHLEERINRDLKTLVYSFECRCPMAKIVAIILGGVYGRGEAGCFTDHSGTEKLYAPYEIVVVIKDMSALQKSYLTQLIATVIYGLKTKLNTSVRLIKVVCESNLYTLPSLPKWYELKWGHRVLWGANTVLAKIPFSKRPVFTAAEALQILFTQGIALVQAEREFNRLLRKKSALQSHSIALVRIWRTLWQTYLICGAVYLILTRAYTATFLAKLRVLRNLEVEDPFLSEIHFSEHYWKALQYMFRCGNVPKAADIKSQFSEIFLIYEKFYFKVFSIYTKRTILDGRTFANAVDRYYRAGLFSHEQSGVRYMVYNVMLLGLKGLRGVWKWYHPRYRLYAAMPGILLKNLPGRGRLVQLAGEALALSRQRYDKSRTIAFLSLWKSV
ncbi:hypothetical protein COTS27_01486 [Spirochaetota bacterium]|nr:hypothetical protein COTS27_01486 [Spirochaetota bacterium]